MRGLWCALVLRVAAGWFPHTAPGGAEFNASGHLLSRKHLERSAGILSFRNQGVIRAEFSGSKRPEHP